MCINGYSIRKQKRKGECKMTLSDISAWCNDHVMMPSRVVYNSESGNKVVFDNGDSYEY